MTSLICREYIESIAKVDTVEGVHAICSSLCDTFGFDGFIYGVRIPSSFVNPHIFVISGYPQEWRDHYVQNDYLRIDPTVSYCANNLLPLTWDRLVPMEKNNDTVRVFLEESRDFGLKSGVSIPVHAVQGERAMLSLSSEDDCHRAHTRIEAAVGSLLLITCHLHEAVRRIVKSIEIYPTTIRLTERESECLLWTAEGKTSWETSMILGISERTVIFHLQNVAEKLQVSNRLHAVARAISLGLITPHI